VNRQSDSLYAAFIEEAALPSYAGPAIFRNPSIEIQIDRRMRLCAAQPESDLLAAAQSQTECLFFWNALQTYSELNRVRSNSHFYLERVQLHIALDEWPRALALSQKSRDIELQSVLSFTFGDFGPCWRHLEELGEMIHCNSLRIVSPYELTWILCLVGLTRMGIEDGDRYAIIDLISLAEAEGIQDAAVALRAILASEFATVVRFVETVEWIAKLSLYICVPQESVKTAVKLNCIAQYCRPFRFVALGEIAAAIGVEVDLAGDLTVSALAAGLIVGRLDFVAGLFERVDGQEEWNHKRAVLDDAVVVRLKSEIIGERSTVR
jgi:hypothetical protein